MDGVDRSGRRDGPGGRRRGPAPTIRLRLTLTYGFVFLVTGAVLLTVGYVLVRHNLRARPDFDAVRHKLGLPAYQAFFPHPPGFAPGSSDRAVAEAVRDQFASDTLHRLLIEYVAALVVMAAISVAAGWVLAGRALAPLRAIAATARRVSGENLGERIALNGPADELKELADTFDRMLERLDSAFASQRRFVANASHELRTPLAIMRTEVDVALADPNASVPELRSMGEAVRETIDRSEGLIEALLVLARSRGHERPRGADRSGRVGRRLHHRPAGAVRAGRDRRDQRPPARAGAGRAEPVGANDREPCRQRSSLQPAGRFRPRRDRSRGGEARLTVRNGGDLIDAGDASTLTEPFRRLDRTSGGYGLGLSIVRSVVQAHGGRIEVSAPQDGGLLVSIDLPADPTAPAVEVSAKKPTSLTRN